MLSGPSPGAERPAFPPALGVAVAVACVSFAAPLFRLADAPAVTASLWRLAFAVLILLPFTRRACPAWRTYRARDWWLVVGTAVALAAHFALWVTSLQLTTVAAATVLVTLQAIFVALGGHFLLGDRLRPANWLGVAVAVAGGLVIAWPDVGALLATRHGADTDGIAALTSSRALLGDALALTAGLGSAAYMLIGRRLRATRGLIEYVVPVYAGAALALLAAALVLGQPVVAGLGSSNFLYFVLLAAVPMLGGHTVSNWVLKHVPAHTVATWILLEPVGAALVACLHPAIREVPSMWVLGGGAIVLLGAALTIPRNAKTAQPSAAVASEPPG